MQIHCWAGMHLPSIRPHAQCPTPPKTNKGTNQETNQKPALKYFQGRKKFCKFTKTFNLQKHVKINYTCSVFKIKFRNLRSHIKMCCLDAIDKINPYSVYIRSALPHRPQPSLMEGPYTKFNATFSYQLVKT